MAGLSGEKLIAALEQAEQAQQQRTEAHPSVWAQEIAFAPAAMLLNGVDDLPSAGSCRNEIDKYCSGVRPGEGRFADCLTQQLAIADSMPGDQSLPEHFTEECLSDLQGYRHSRAQSINLNVPLARACKKDIKKFCTENDDDGSIMWCLRREPERISQRCYNQVFKAAQIANDDIRAAPELYNACKPDLKRHCKTVKYQHGKAQQCLREAGSKLDWNCRELLFQDAMASTDDIRLATHVFRTCLDDKKKFCPQVEPGHARAITCLEDHRYEADFSSDCRDTLETLMSERAADFRLDPNLRKFCKRDIEHTCGLQLKELKKDIAEKAKVEDDGAVVACLQDNRNDLKEHDCTLAVHATLIRASSDVRLDPSVSGMCHEDRQNLCSTVPAGSARVWICLQQKRLQLSSGCKAALFDHEVDAAESIDFQYPLKQACLQDLNFFCRGVAPEGASAIRCLQDHEMQPLFTQKCRDELASHDHFAATDYRLNSRLKDTCQHVVQSLCSHVQCPSHQPCGGRMLSCLSSNVAAIQNISCRNEVIYYMRMGVKDFENDILFAEACRPDAEKFCKAVRRGQQSMYECLYNHRADLTPECVQEQMRMMTAAYDNYELQPTLQNDCGQERALLCPGVRPGMSRMFNCLIAKADQTDFSQGCRKNIANQHMKRMMNWRLDYNLRKTCADDVSKFCAQQDAEARGQKAQGQVLQCLLAHRGSLSAQCGTSVTRVIHSSLKFYRPGLPFTSSCDGDVAKWCIPDALQRRWRSQQHPGSDRLAALGPNAYLVPPGQILSCLEEHLPRDQEFEFPIAVGEPQIPGNSSVAQEPFLFKHISPARTRPLSDNCAALVGMGSPQPFDEYVEVLASGRLASTLRRVQNAMSLPDDTLVSRSSASTGQGFEVDGLTLTGWSALGGAAALMLLVLVAICTSWRKFLKTKYGGYRMVAKSRRPAEVQMR